VRDVRADIEVLSGCFQDLNEDDLAFIQDKKTRVDFQKGETIFKQGAFAKQVLFVNKGLVRVFLQTGKSKQLNLLLAKSGDFIAFSTVFGEEKYNCSAAAISDSIVCMIDKDALKELLLRNPEFAMKITAKNSQIESHYMDVIKNLSYKQMRGKLASALLYLTKKEYADCNVFEQLTRKDIADFASITLESTVKFLKEFEKEKVISLNSKNIDILDQKSLLLLSNNG